MLLPLAMGWSLAMAAAQTLILDAEQVWDFAEELFQDGEYYRAISEYRRLAHYFPEHAFVPSARVRVGESLLRGGEAAAAARHFEELAEEPEMADRRGELLYLRGLSRLETEPQRPYPLRVPMIRAAMADFRAIPPDWPDRERVDGFIQALEQPRELPYKSPVLAGTLSAVVPGAGSFYVGRYAEGALALFVNSVLIYSTVELVQADSRGAALVVGGLGLAFYGGSILAAANGAHKHNDRARASYLAEQRTRFGIVVDRAGLAGAFQQKF